MTNASNADEIVISADGGIASFLGSGLPRRRSLRRRHRRRRELQLQGVSNQSSASSSDGSADTSDGNATEVEEEDEDEEEVAVPPLLTIAANAPRVTIRGLRFSRSAGAPALLVLGAHVIVEDCWFERNAGGALRVQGDSLVELRNTRFESNGGSDLLVGGAIVVDGGDASFAGRAEGLPRVEATGCSLTLNTARYGGAIAAQTAHVALSYTSVSSNTALVRGGALHAVDTFLLLANESLLVENVAPVGNGSSAYVASSTPNNAGGSAAWQYALPTPMGYWIANSEPCAPGEPCSGASRDPLASLAAVTVANLALGALEDEYPFACPPGTFGSSVSVAAQTGPSCSGICPAGYFCVAGTTEPEPCPTGYYCKRGSPAPTPCVPGTYSDVAMLTGEQGCRACPEGHYCGSGTSAPIACPVATYNELPRQTNLTACQQCPEHSLTDAGGAVSASLCTCRNNFVKGVAEDTGAATCKCPAGYGFDSAAGGASCKECELGFFKDEWDNYACQPCHQPGVIESGHATTDAEAATSSSQCICEAGYYLATWTDADADGEPDSDEAYYSSHDDCVARGAAERFAGGVGANCTTDCLPCSSTWKYEDSGGTNCNVTGVTLETLPVQRGFYRQGALAHYVRPCVVTSICLGGEDASDEQCMVGHTGPYCSLCAENYTFDAELQQCRLCSAANPEALARAGAIGSLASLVVLAIALRLALKNKQWSSLITTWNTKHLKDNLKKLPNVSRRLTLPPVPQLHHSPRCIAWARLSPHRKRIL